MYKFNVGVDIKDKEIETFLKLKTYPEWESFFRAAFPGRTNPYLSIPLIALESLPLEDLPLYVNHPCPRFKRFVKYRLSVE